MLHCVSLLQPESPLLETIKQMFLLPGVRELQLRLTLLVNESQVYRSKGAVLSDYIFILQQISGKLHGTCVKIYILCFDPVFFVKL